MRLRNLLLTLTALAGLGLASLAIAQSPPAPAYTENGFTPALLDAQLSQADRMQAFAKVMALANRGQVRAQDLAGTLYWQGSRIAGSPVPTDLGQARKLLANAAIHGDTLAMAKMAELELGAGRAPQAMVWAQLYTRYLAPLVPIRQGRGRYSAYGAVLIQRIEQAGGKIDKATQINVGAMVKRFDRSIKDGQTAYRDELRHGRTILTRPPMGNDTVKESNINGVAEYMVAFDEQGKATRIWSMDAFPDPALLATFRHYLDTVHANSADAGTGMRYRRISITHNAAKWIQLRPRH